MDDDGYDEAGAQVSEMERFEENSPEADLAKDESDDVVQVLSRFGGFDESEEIIVALQTKADLPRNKEIRDGDDVDGDKSLGLADDKLDDELKLGIYKGAVALADNVVPSSEIDMVASVAYETLLEHRRKQVNTVEILHRLEFVPSGRAQMDIPLCRMKKLEAVRIALDNDVAKMQADFIHGYVPGTAVFYVSPTNFEGDEEAILDSDQESWGEHWRAKDRDFEDFLRSDPDLRKVGFLPISKFSQILTHEEMLAALVQKELPAEKKPWYPIPRTRFLEYIHSQKLAEAGDDGQRRFEDETPTGKQTAAGLKAAIDTAVEAKRPKLSMAFTKFIAIANPGNNKQFLVEVSEKHFKLKHSFLDCILVNLAVWYRTTPAASRIRSSCAGVDGA